MLVSFIFFGPWRKKLIEIIKLSDFSIIVQSIIESKMDESSYYIHYVIITWWNYNTKSLKQFPDEIVKIISRKISPIFQKTKRNINLKYLLSKKTYKNQNWIKFKSHVRLRKKQLHDVSKEQLTVDISWTWLKWVSGCNKNLLAFITTVWVSIFGNMHPSMSMFIHKRPNSSHFTIKFSIDLSSGSLSGYFSQIAFKFCKLFFHKICKINDRKNHTVQCFQTFSQ